jgi:acyl-coenzyme A synthetase/AMP-(fatty) acid ligase
MTSFVDDPKDSWNNYLFKYSNGVRNTFCFCDFRDKNGYYQITGRVDDVINVTGHRLGTAEVEDVMVNTILLGSRVIITTTKKSHLKSLI